LEEGTTRLCFELGEMIGDTGLGHAKKFCGFGKAPAPDHLMEDDQRVQRIRIHISFPYRLLKEIN
jgi:hypothetical protein